MNFFRKDKYTKEDVRRFKTIAEALGIERIGHCSFSLFEFGFDISQNDLFDFIATCQGM